MNGQCLVFVQDRNRNKHTGQPIYTKLSVPTGMSLFEGKSGDQTRVWPVSVEWVVGVLIRREEEGRNIMKAEIITCQG